MANKKLIYTVITNDYDKPRGTRNSPGWDYVIFTDNPNLKALGWKIKVMPKSDNPCKQQRLIKILSHKYTQGYNLTIYIDGNFQQIIDADQLIKNYYKGGFLTCLHDKRNNIEDEGLQIVNLAKDSESSVKNTIEFVKESGCPIDFGLWATGCIVRDKSEAVMRLELVWAKALEQYSHRDQLTLPYASYMTGTPIHGIKRAIMYSYFKLMGNHITNPALIKNDKGFIQPLKIFYSNPFNINKNIGKALNEFCSLLPEDSWIVLQDGDITYLTPDWGERIYKSLALNGDQFGLIGCYTNRLKGLHQCHDNTFSNDMNIKNHIKIAQSDKYRNLGITDLKSFGVAGCFMAFKKSTWKKVGGFVENHIAFDTLFNQSVKAKGMKIGIMDNLYVFHLYRAWSDKNPFEEKSHLK